MAGRLQDLSRLLLNQWHTIHELAGDLYEDKVNARSLRAVRQALSRLRDALGAESWPIAVPAGRILVLDERWQRKADGRGSEKAFRLRQKEPRATPAVSPQRGASWLQLWLSPSSWSGWIVPGFQALQQDRLIRHNHLYTDARGPDNWLTVASSEMYREAERAAGAATYEELHASKATWMSEDLIYLGLGTGSGMADVRVLRELLDQDRQRRVRAVPLDFSPVLLSETVANLYQEFHDEISAGRLEVQPILGDLEQPGEWVRLLPTPGEATSLLIGMFGNTIGHLQNRERATLQGIFDELDSWADNQGVPPWTTKNTRVILGISLKRPDGAPHGRNQEATRRWLNLICDPLKTLLETSEGEYQMVLLEEDRRIQDEQNRTSIAELRRRGPRGVSIGHICHEEIPYRPSDGITGVVQRYVFVFDRNIQIEGQKVFRRHHLPESRWNEAGALRAKFAAGEDEIVVCEVTQFDLRSFRAALKRLSVAHSDAQVTEVKVGSARPYVLLAFARWPDAAARP